ncbi:unnamed protein product, partial [Ectocarpus sp. 12 AP-2014]
MTDLLDLDTIASAGTGAVCSWEDGTTVRITFGPGSTLAENSTVVLNSESEYISGCATCTEYSSGSTTVKARDSPPELSAAQFTNTGAQVTVDFTGNPSSQEINGTFSSVSCESVFSAASASTLGIGSTCQFSSSSSIKVTLGVLSSIVPSSSDACTDGDGTSLTLLAGVVRTEIGAFLTTSAGCVVVDFPANPDPPYVTVSAPSAIGYCDDLTLEGSATSASIGTTNVTWEVALAGNGQFGDISNVTRHLEEASLDKYLTVRVPSEYIAQGLSYTFVLRVETALGGSSTAEAEVFKSPAELLLSKIVGSSVLQRTRGNAITLRSETTTSTCSTTNTEEAIASYSWSMISANESFARGVDVPLGVGRDPRVLTIPSYALGYAGSSYQLQLRTSFGGIS